MNNKGMTDANVVTESDTRNIVKKIATESDAVDIANNAHTGSDTGDNIVTIESSEGECVKVKSDLLIKHSDYFRALFESGMRETLEKHVHLPLISTDIQHVCVTFTNSGELLADKDSIHSVLQAASYLQMGCLFTACSKYLLHSLENIDPDVLLKLARDFDIDTLEDKTFQHMCDNFKDLFHRERVCVPTLQRMEFDDLLKLLKSDKLKVDSEMEVYQVMLLYIKHLARSQKCWPIKSDDEDRINQLFDVIRYPLMHDGKLDICWERFCDLRIKEAFTDYEILKTKMQRNAIETNYPHNISPTWLIEMRNTIPCLVAVAGYTDYTTECTNWFQILETDSFLSKIDNDIANEGSQNCEQYPENIVFRLDQNLETSKVRLPKRVEHRICVHQGCIYLCGGESDWTAVTGGMGKLTSNEVFCFDTRRNQWFKKESMMRPRMQFYMAVLGEYMYAVGGVRYANTINRLTERYSFQTGKWTPRARLPIRLSEHAGCIHNDRIYISGGSSPGQTDQTFCYDHLQDTWTELAPMLQRRSFHAMAHVDDSRIVVAGGYHYDGDYSTNVLHCEIYDSDEDQWAYVTLMPDYASETPYIVIQQKLCIFGGCSIDEEEHQKVQVLDLTTMKWTTSTDFKANKITNFALCEMKLPAKEVGKHTCVAIGLSDD